MPLSVPRVHQTDNQPYLQCQTEVKNAGLYITWTTGIILDGSNYACFGSSNMRIACDTCSHFLHALNALG